MISSINDTSRPFLRWAGGKRWLMKEIHRFLPSSFKNYHEPFVGAGSFFFKIRPQNGIFLSDLNEELINVYIQIRDNLDSLLYDLNSFKIDKKEYYRIRKAKFNSDVERAARFIYLNKTCFNGIYRVNRNGEFNVPYGKNYRANIYNLEKLKSVSNVLKSVLLASKDFYETLSEINQGDLVILDPPYTVSHSNNGFIEYNQKIFSWNDQIRLSKYIGALIEKKAYYIMTNAFHYSINKLYFGLGRKFIIQRNSLIGGKNAKREKIKEYLFTFNSTENG